MNRDLHQLECLFPHEIESEIQKHPYILVPVGSIEWHGHHNVVGLDGLKAHAILRLVAERCGGVVYPAIFTGHYTGNVGCPYNMMIERDVLFRLLSNLLEGFDQAGFKKAVLLCGHYPNYHFVAKTLAEEWGSRKSRMEVLALVENQIPGIAGDHAGRDETSLMLHLRPELVRLASVREGRTDVPGVDIRVNNLEVDARHPCYGVVGVDPWHATAEHGHLLAETLVEALVGWLSNGMLHRNW